MSELQGKPTAQSGVTRYRFPYTPLPFGVFGGVDRDAIFRPIKRVALHHWHQAHGGVLDDYGSWLRPAHYLKAGETPRQAEQREAVAVRTGVGVFDDSPLGKIEVLGPDAAAFLDLIHANRMSDLAVGKCRYGLMLNELGVVIDDGVCSRFCENHFLVGATSAGATRIVAWLEEWLQCEWVNFNVIVAPVTQSWDVITVTGPRARDLLRKVGVDFDCEP